MPYKNVYLTASTDFGIPLIKPEKVPDGQLKERKKKYIDKWVKVCLHCNLEKCYRDDVRDDDSKKRNIAKHIRKQLMEAKAKCPIVIAKKNGWEPERMLSELSSIILTRR